MDAELAGHVIGCGDNAPPLGRAAHDDRLPGQLRPVALLDRGIEGVHVEMDDFSAGVPHRLLDP